MGFFMPDPDSQAGYFGSADLSGLNDPELLGPMPFGIPLAAIRTAFGAPPSNDPSTAASDDTGADALAQAVSPALRAQCLNLCYPLTLAKPPGSRPVTFEQCMAHCEGRSEWKPLLPLIPFGGGH